MPCLPILLLLLLQCQLTPLSAFGASTPSTPSIILQPATYKNDDIQISIATTNADILSLSDLRYQEWMANDPNPPRISSFRMATAEVFHERQMEGSLVSLATMMLNAKDNGKYVTVGAGELSPIELQAVLLVREEQSDGESMFSQIKPLYVTDVVTSSSHRRLGIGSKLMDSIGQSAYAMGSRCVFLHVEYDNIGAIDFYKRLGYVPLDADSLGDTAISSDGLISFSFGDGGLNIESISSASTNARTDEVLFTFDFDTNQLAENAGAIGQLLMMKELNVPTAIEKDGDVSLPIQPDVCTSTSPAVQQGGFGKHTSKRKKKNRKR